MKKRFLASSRLLLLLLLLLLCLFPALPAQAAVLGEYIDGYDTLSAGGLVLSQGVYWTGSDYRTENYLTYRPGSGAMPLVVYGSKLLNYGDFPTMAALLEQQGYTVLGGINGDYYNTADYQPLGIVVTEGILRSSDGGHAAVGFRADGSVIIGKPALNMTMNIAGAEYALGAVNKTRGADNFTLFSEDHSYTTQTKTPGRSVIASVVAGGPLRVNCQLTLRVEEMITGSEPLELKPGQFILSLADTAHAWRQGGMDALYPGETFSVNISCEPGWDQAAFAVGSLYKLVSNGMIEPGLDESAAPRTAVGMKADGDLVLYTIDGRQGGHSVGASMTQVAQRLLEMGCTEAALMDGGGSTTLNAAYAGDNFVSQVNKPSDGKQRSVTNYIMLATSARAGGQAESLALYPLSLHILSGAEARFTAKAVDGNGLAASIPRNLSYNADASIGSIDDNGLFRAEGSGWGAVTVSAGGVESATVLVDVVADPDSISIHRQDNPAQLTSLEIAAGSSAALFADAMYRHMKLVAAGNCFSWQVEGDIGSVDANGLFTAADTRGTGAIIVSAGAVSAVLPVTVTRANSYDDVLPADWYFSAVEYVSSRGLFTGTDEYIFSPKSSMSRAMIATVLHRLAGLPEAAPAGFTDVPANMWYSNAIGWAAANGVASGYGDGRFGTNDPVTREQIANILYHYAMAAGRNISAGADISAYSDASSVSAWAEEAMRWAVASGMITGLPDNTLNPRGTANRAEVATMLTRFCQLLEDRG